MNLRHINPQFLGELQGQLLERDVDLGDVEIREWTEFPYEGVQVLIAFEPKSRRWNVGTSSGGGAFLVPSEKVYGSVNVAQRIAEGIAAYVKEMEGK